MKCNRYHFGKYCRQWDSLRICCFRHRYLKSMGSIIYSIIDLRSRSNTMLNCKLCNWQRTYFHREHRSIHPYLKWSLGIHLNNCCYISSNCCRITDKQGLKPWYCTWHSSFHKADILDYKKFQLSRLRRT